MLLRLHDLVLDRQDEIIDLIVLGVRQGPQARVRRAAAHRADRALLRAHRSRPPRHRSASSASSPASPGSRSTASQGRRRHHLAVELPVHDGAVRRAAGAAGGQRRGRQARRPDHAHRAARRRAARGGRLPDGPVAGRRRSRLARSAPTIIERADYVCFTGSTATGKLVAKQCAERLIGCSLELGGKNPILVLRDADLEKAAEGAVRASFSNAGQLCVSMERMFVADQVYDRFVERFVARTEAMTLGASLDWGIDMGSLISPGPARHRRGARRRRRRQGRPRAHRRPAPARPRPVLLRADHPRGRHART